MSTPDSQRGPLAVAKRDSLCPFSLKSSQIPDLRSIAARPWSNGLSLSPWPCERQYFCQVPRTLHLDSALEATVADSIVAIREGKISVKMSPSRRCMRRLKIRWYITASASSICLTAVQACRRVRNCPISTKRPRHTKDMLIPSSNWHSSMNEASAQRPTRTMRWPNTASPQARTISKRSIIWRFYCHAATM